ncbi:uncharacterized protein LOC129944725 isoform X1 [Eupeodes corollae]|uniref:uncharacterized protein LOC129944725 isoform X1 n=1 Tax=Eupeodes corollae TaxID=290404 RepID=UPI0024919879|nr:uncharacterized protein LOC129944725 isoform X1 [Eupeodes corollae]
MVFCFLCKSFFKDLKSLKSHFNFSHSEHEFLNYKCNEDGCKRSFSSFNSFRRHIQKEHISLVQNHPNCIDDIESEPNDFIKIYPKRIIEQFNMATVSKTPPVNESLSIFIASLYGNVLLPRNVVQKVIEGLKEFFSTLGPAINNTVNAICQEYSLSNDISKVLVETLVPTIISPLESFMTEQKRISFYSKKKTYIAPQGIVIGQRFDHVKRNGISRMEVIDCQEHFIPLRNILQTFFSLENVLAETLEYMDSLKDKNVMENFIQGSYWKNRVLHHSNRIVLPLFIYFDDYEIGNVLGSHAGVHKLGAVYVSIPCLSPWRSSVLSNIFLILLFHSSDRVSFGNNIIFKPVIDDFNFLSEEGIQIDVPTFKGTLYFELGLILGDNLGIHSMIGFVESFSANFSCRVCKVTKADLKEQLYENTALLRTTDSYEGDLALNNLSLTGIKERCVFLGIKGFDLFQQVGADVMHDVLEGVAKYILSFMLNKYTQNSKFFTLAIFNDKLLAFEYGPDSKNKPCSIEKEHLKRGNIRLSSGEMLTLLRFLGLLIGDFIPRDDDYWALYTNLRKILDILLSVRISPGTDNLLQVLIAELNELYIKLTKDSLKPKFHNLLHYHTALKKYGPLSSFWSMRFEAKHRQSKMSARSSCNQINVTWSLAMKHQLSLNEMFLRGKLCNILEVGPKKIVPLPETKILQSLLQLDPKKTLIRVNWATMSSILYKKGSILVKSLNSDRYLYNFFLLEKIYLYNCDCLIFEGMLLQTLCFDDHYYAYEVEVPSLTNQVTMLLESFLSPIPNTLNTLPNGRQYVILRSPL